MKTGDIVTVFTDVAHRAFPEGRAMLLARLDDCDLCKAFNAENWRVRFLDCPRTDARLVNVEQPTLAESLFNTGVLLSKIAGGVA